MTKEPVPITAPCLHIKDVKIREVQRPAPGCPECLAMGSPWLHLRICLTCGHVGCCDSSPNRHASRHFRATGHPIMTSAEPGETWVWCFVDRAEISA